MSQINESAIATPGVYVTEVPAFPPSVAQVATAIPIFIGYTPQAIQNGKPVYKTPVRISSLVEFTTYFGTGFDDLEAYTVLNATEDGVDSVYFTNKSIKAANPSSTIGFQLFNAMQMFFNQGGSNCYILAWPVTYVTTAGVTKAMLAVTDFMPITAGSKTIFDIIQKEDEPTLIVIPDAVLMDPPGFNSLMNASLHLCGQMQDRFTIMDVLNGDKEHDSSPNDPIPGFRDGVTDPALNYGAAYYPYLRTSLPYTPSSPNSFAYANIGIFKNDGTTALNGSDVLNSAVALQLENADSDQTSIIQAFIDSPNFSGPETIALPVAMAALVTAINKANIASGFGMIPTVPQVDPAVEYAAKLAYIANLLDKFINLSSFKDQTPNVSVNAIFNKYLAPGTPASGGNPAVYSPIEKLMRELITLDDVFDVPAVFHTAKLLGTAVTNFHAVNASYQLTVTPLPAGNDVYGDSSTVPSGSIPAFEMSFVRGRVQTLYNNVLNYINSFNSDVQAYITSLDTQLATASKLYGLIKKAIANTGVVTPPSGAMAGIYAAVDGSRGVWKAPANVALNSVIEPMVVIDDNLQGDLNIDPQTGKSINAIRAFTGKGTLVWGARTLTGNDNDFRYIPVRRFFIMVEESVKLASYQFVFEPNASPTWVRIRAMIENYLTNLWRLGALAGSKPEQAFYVKVGLGQTMIFDDILNGKMIVEIGMAPVRPAEFIILRFTQIQQTS